MDFSDIFFGFRSGRTVKVIKCSYDTVEEKSSQISSNGKRKKQKIQQIRSFQELQLPPFILTRMKKRGFNMLDMPKQLQESLGTLKSFSNSSVEFNFKNGKYFMFLTLSLFIVTNVQQNMKYLQIMVVCERENQLELKDMLNQVIGEYLNVVIITNERMNFKEASHIITSRPQCLIASCETLLFTLKKNYIQPPMVESFFLLDIKEFSGFRSTNQNRLQSLINSLPEEVNKYFFHDPTQCPMTESLYNLLED